MFQTMKRTVGAVRRLNAINARMLSLMEYSKVVSHKAFGGKPHVPHLVRWGTRFFADRIRLSEFARIVTVHARWRRNWPGTRVRGERAVTAPVLFRW